MNKKFSTLVAGVLLAASVGMVGTVDAATSASYVKFGKASTEFSEIIKAGSYYQLTTGAAGTEVIAMVPSATTGAYELKAVNSTDATKTELRYTLWTIDVQGNATDGYRYVFMNLGTGMPLAYNTKDAVTGTATTSTPVGGEVSLWKWMDAYNPVNGFIATDAKELTSVFGAKNDSIVTLANNTGSVYAVKYALNNKPATITGQIKVVPVDPSAVVLGVDDLNSMLWNGDAVNGKLGLTFNPDVKNNEYKNVFAQSLKAESAVGYPFRNFLWELPTTLTNDATQNADNAEDALLKYNSQYAALNAYEVAQHQAAFANAIKALLGANDANQAAINTALVALNAAFVTDYATGLAAVTAYDFGVTTDEVKALNEKVRAAVIAFIKSEMPNVVNNGIVTPVTSVITAVTNQSTAQLTAYVAALALDTKQAAANAEKESVRGKWDAQGWVSLKTNAGKYVMVDTAYMTSAAGQKYLKISDDKTFKDLTMKSNGESISPISWTREDINGRYNFQFVWHPVQDSIVIRSAGFATLSDGEVATPIWSDLSLPETMIPTATSVNPASPAERNIIKIAVLANTSHRELTIGNSEYDRLMSPTNTINTRISINGSSQYTKTTLAEGVYFFNLSSVVKKAQNGKYLVAPFCGDQAVEYVAEEQAQLYGQAQDFGHMPRTQWVVEQNPGVSGQQTVNIYNREFPGQYAAKNVQLYKGGDNAVFAMYNTITAANDTLSYVRAEVAKPKAGILTDKYLGYAPIAEDALTKIGYNMDYFNGIKIGNYVNVNTTAVDTTVYVDLKGEKVTVELEAVTDDLKFGYTGHVAPQLYKKAYTIRVYDGSKLSNNNKFVVEDPANEATYAISYNKDNAAQFYLKENNQLISEAGDTTCYYALISSNKTVDPTRVGVRDASMKFSIEGQCSEERVATFALKESTSPLYRRLGVSNPEDGLKDNDVNKFAKVYRTNSTAKEYLYEDAQSVYSAGKGINFLGVEGKGDNKLSALYVDTAYVRNDTKMPQYMFAVGVTEVPAGMLCPDNAEHNTPEYIANHGDCGHKVPSQGYKIGRYLINAEDSVQASKNSKNYIWNEKYTRLAFVWAKHIGDTLVVMRDGKDMNLMNALASDSIFLGDNKHNMSTWTLNADASKNTKGDSIHASHTNGIKNAVFALRLIDDKPACDFLIESVGDKPIPSDGKGGWIKIQNGVPVIARVANYNEAILDTEIFNIEPTTEEATSNEGVTTSEVSVISSTGSVIVKGAAGKAVTISNILGQVIAKTVLTSDNATISVPAGIVAVAVEGEEAVKAVVR